MTGATPEAAAGLSEAGALIYRLWMLFGAPSDPFCAYCGESLGTQPRMVAGQAVYRLCRRCERYEVLYWSGDRASSTPGSVG